MHVTRKISFVYGVAALIFSCSPPEKTITNDDLAKLLQIHEDARDAPEMISVNHGKIHKTTSPEKDMEGFQSYFNSVEFKKWDDVKSPEVRFSDDHTLAYMVVDKLVVLEAKDSVGKPFEETTHYAWVSIYRKQNTGDWKLECIASTNEPEVVKKID